MAMGDFSPWTNSGNTSAATPAPAATTPAASTTTPGFFGTTTGAQNVTNALTGTATSATTGYNAGATNPAASSTTKPTWWQMDSVRNPYHYDAWGQSPTQSFYGSNPGFWNFQGGGHQM